jgi:hypothetical protein
MKQYLPEKMSYKQGKKTLNVDPEDIGFVYNIIKRMEESEQNIILRNSLSYKQADELFLSEYGKKCGKNKFSAIIKILMKQDMIKKVANYKVGLRGNCYRTTKTLD